MVKYKPRPRGEEETRLSAKQLPHQFDSGRGLHPKLDFALFHTVKLRLPLQSGFFLGLIKTPRVLRCIYEKTKS